MSNDSLLNDFLAECREHLEGIESDLLAIEEAGESADHELVNKVFRAAHSIKGGAGFFNLEKIKTLGHKTETVLDMIRSRILPVNSEIINILLISFDKLREMVNNVDNLSEIEITDNITALENIAAQTLPSGEKEAVNRNVRLTSENGSYTREIPEMDMLAAGTERQFIYQIQYDLIHDFEKNGKSPIELMESLGKMGVIIDCRVDFEAVGTLDDSPGNSLPMNVVYRTVADPDIISDAVETVNDKIHLLYDPRSKDKKSSEKVNILSGNTPENTEGKPMNVSLAEKSPSSAKETDIHKLAGPSEENESSRQSANSASDTLRVNVAALETLMTQAGELVLGRNQLLDAISRKDSRAIEAAGQRISFVTTELQDAVMRTRLQPIGNVFGKFPRVVRDIARAFNKQIELIIEGRDVELDKTIIEGLSDPLTHMVRNAADHGIELPDIRKRNGKPAVGNVWLRAYHEAGQVVIEVEDDGKGIDSEKVASKALSMGLITGERLKGMTEQDKIALIFLPGLSTAEKVTEVSGRGVGMDVVKTNLDHLGGKVEIHSTPGKGSTFRVKLPLTLAIIPSLILSEQGDRYAIPQVNVVELIHVGAAQVKENIEVVGDAEVLVLRGNLIPLVRFSDVLGLVRKYIDPKTGKTEIDRRGKIADRRSDRYKIDQAQSDSAKLKEEFKDRRTRPDRRENPQSDLNIVIVASGMLHYGLVVDELRDTEEIVVKPLGRHLKGLQEYAGATIMGDGGVALILDATGLALKADISSVAASTRAKIVSEQQRDLDETTDSHSLLLMENDPGERIAVPLNLVQRVERITGDKIEVKGGRRTMQYRGISLPLVTLADAAQVNQVSNERELAVVVTAVAGRDVGILGAMPVSVVESRVRVDGNTHKQKGISGSTIIDDKTVLMVDVFELVETAHPEWVVKKKEFSDSNGITLLLAEDSDFFRGQVSKYLQEAGFDVIAAVDGQEAWELLEQNAEKIRLVVTDIEMPRMNGLELCKKIRSDSRFAQYPVIALTTLASEEDEARGKAAGVTDYQVKLDRDKMIESIKNVMNKTVTG